MLYITKELKEAFKQDLETDPKELENFKEYIKELHKQGNTQDLKKLLGVFYTPVVNFLCSEEYIAGRELEIGNKALADYGLTPNEAEQMIKIALTFYNEEDFKEYGDSKVTEQLNYYRVEGNDPIVAYCKTI